MTSLIFVHGVPETPVVWKPLIEQLDHREVVCLQLPGFGMPVPEGFVATKDAYAEWLIKELEGFQNGGSVDVVGHDWGGALTLRVAALRPDLVRCWISDTAAIADPGFEWHASARQWQTVGEGEELFAQQLALPVAVRSRFYEAAGASSDVASELAKSLDQIMVDCILALYRS